MTNHDVNDSESLDELHLSQMINWADEVESSQNNNKIDISDDSIDEAEASALVEVLDEVERNESQINSQGINMASQTTSNFYFSFGNNNFVNEEQLFEYLTNEVVKRLDRVFAEPMLTFSRIQLEGVVENAMNRVRTECRHMVNDIVNSRLAQFVGNLSSENSGVDLESDNEYFPSEDDGPSTSTPRFRHPIGKKKDAKQLKDTGGRSKRKNGWRTDSESDTSECSESGKSSSTIFSHKNRKRTGKKTNTRKNSLKKSRLVLSSTESESVVTSSTDTDENSGRSPDEVYDTDDFIDDNGAEETTLSSRRRRSLRKLRSPRRQRFTCDICNELFCDERLFALHKKRHAKCYTR